MSASLTENGPLRGSQNSSPLQGDGTKPFGHKKTPPCGGFHAPLDKESSCSTASQSGVHPSMGATERSHDARRAATPRSTMKDVWRHIQQAKHMKPKLEEFVGHLNLDMLGGLAHSAFRSQMTEFLSFAIRIRRATAFFDVIHAAFDYLRHTFSFEELKAYTGQVLKCALTYYESLAGQVVTEATPLTDAFDEMLNVKSRFTDSAIFKAIKNFVISLASLKFFSKDVSRAIFTKTGTAPANDFAAYATLLEAFRDILAAGERLNNGESLTDIMASESPVKAYFLETDKLLSLQDFTYVGLPVEGMIHRPEFCMRLARAIELGDVFLGNLSSNNAMFARIHSVQLKLRVVHNKITNQINGTARMTPAAIKIIGPPGVGKSSVLDIVAKIHSEVMGREFKEEYIFHKNISSQYWEGYNPRSQDVIHISEAGNLALKLATSTVDEKLQEITSLVDSLPMTVDMAFDGKGNTYATPTLVVADANTFDMNANYQVNNPAAFHRRWLTIDVMSKPEFRVDGALQLDSDKCAEQPNMDYWHFALSIYRAKSASTGDRIYLAQQLNVFELREELKKFLTKHYSNQSVMIKGRADLDVRDFVAPENQERKPQDEAVTGELLTEALPSQPVNLFEEHPEIWEHIGGGPPAPPVVLRTGPSQPAKLLPHQELMKRASYYMYVAKERVPRVARIQAYHIASIGWFTGVSMLWWGATWTPDSVAGRIVRNHARTQKNQQLNRVMLHARLFLRNFGIVTNDDPFTRSVWEYAAAIAAIGVLIQLFRWTSEAVATEGAGMTRIHEMDEAEVRDAIDLYEEVIEAAPPRVVKAPKRVNEDWFSKETSRLEYLGDKRTTNAPEEILLSSHKNLRYYYVTSVSNGYKKSIKTRGFGICEDFVIINAHAAQGKTAFTLEQYDETYTTLIRTIVVTQSARVAGDVTMARVCGDKFRDLRNLIVERNLNPSHFYGWAGNVCDKKTGYPAARITVKDQIHLKEDGVPTIFYDVLCYQWPEHEGGVCGTPILAQVGGSFCIVGIHCAGSESTPQSHAARFTSDRILLAIRALSAVDPYLRVNSMGTMRLEGLQDHPNDYSALNYEGSSRLVYHGTVPGKQLSSKSNLQRSLIFDIAKTISGASPFKEDGVEHYGPPVMRGIRVEDKYYEPYANFYRKVDNPKVALDRDIMRKSMDAIVEHLTEGLRARGVTSLSPVSTHVAQNGHVQNAYMRSMKNSTSGGYPWPGTKRKYCVDSPTEDLPEAKMPKPEVLEQMAFQAGQYAQDKDGHPLLGAQLKDEARSYKKNAFAKTRVFMMSPYESTVLQRSLLMPFYTLMCEHRDLFMCSIGINMHSTDVDEFVQDLSDFSDAYMEGDYGGFDTSMPYEIGLAANTIVYRMLREFGYTEECLRLVKGILSDNLYPTCVVKGDVVQIPALQPSGKYATAEDNSLRGLVMLVYFYAAQFPERATSTFFDQVKAKIYGDDLIAAVKPTSRELFNNNTYAKFCAEVYNIEYTNAQKTAEFKDFLSLGEISFLKRTFVWREDLGHYVAPLDRVSIMKSVAYLLPSKAVSVEDQTTDMVVSAVREMFFYKKEDDYNAYREEVAALVEERFGITAGGFLERLPSFRTIRDACYGCDLVTESATVRVAMGPIKRITEAAQRWWTTIKKWAYCTAVELSSLYHRESDVKSPCPSYVDDVSFASTTSGFRFIPVIVIPAIASAYVPWWVSLAVITPLVEEYFMLSGPYFRFVLALGEFQTYGTCNLCYHLLTPVLYPKKDLGRRKAFLLRTVDHAAVNGWGCLQHVLGIEIMLPLMTRYVNFMMVAVVVRRLMRLHFVVKNSSQFEYY